MISSVEVSQLTLSIELATINLYFPEDSPVNGTVFLVSVSIYCF